MTHGRHIVLECVNGETVKQVRDQLIQSLSGFDVNPKMEPGSEWHLVARLRALPLNSEARILSRLQILIYSQMHAHHYSQAIEPVLKSGSWCIGEQSDLTMFAHLTTDIGALTQERALHYFRQDSSPDPDLTIILGEHSSAGRRPTNQSAEAIAVDRRYEALAERLGLPIVLTYRGAGWDSREAVERREPQQIVQEAWAYIAPLLEEAHVD